MLSPWQFYSENRCKVLGPGPGLMSSVQYIQFPQGEEKASRSDNKTRGTGATPTPVSGTTAEPKNQPVLVSVTPIRKRKCQKQKSAHLVRDEGVSSKREQEKDVEKTGCSETGLSWENRRKRRDSCWLDRRKMKDSYMRQYPHNPYPWVSCEIHKRVLAVVQVNTLSVTSLLQC